MTIEVLPESPNGEVTHGQVREKINEIIQAQAYHFGAYTVTQTTVSADPDAPTYLTGVGIFGSSSPEFQLIAGVDGEQWLKNVSTKTFTMEGDSMWQMAQGAGNVGELILWSERSSDDGATFTENASSLRRLRVNNNANSSVAVPTAVGAWLPDECVRWAMITNQPSAVVLQAPSVVVNGGNTVTGLAVYWQLSEV